MAAALFAEQIADRADSVEVSSAGLLPGGIAVPDEVLEVMETYGIDLAGHRSRTLTEAMLHKADLVIGMGLRHVQEAVLLDPPCWPQAFRLKELVRRGSIVGSRRAEQGIRSWIDAAHGDRARSSLAHRSANDEVADPYGGPRAGYTSAAEELAQLTSRLTELLWPEDEYRLEAVAEG